MPRATAAHKCSRPMPAGSCDLMDGHRGPAGVGASWGCSCAASLPTAVPRSGERGLSREGGTGWRGPRSSALVSLSHVPLGPAQAPTPPHAQYPDPPPQPRAWPPLCGLHALEKREGEEPPHPLCSWEDALSPQAQRRLVGRGQGQPAYRGPPSHEGWTDCLTPQS